MAVTNIPNVTNWSVTPQNGQVGYFSLMNTWLSESTAVIASLQTAITAQNTANSEINDLAIQVADNATDAQNARDEAVSAIAILSSGAIDDTTIANNKAYSNQKTNDLLEQKVDKNISSYASKTTPIDSDLIPLSDSASSFGIKKLTWANIKATLISSFGVMISTLTAKTTPVDADIFTIGDSTETNASKKLTWANIKTALVAYLGTGTGFVISRSTNGYIKLPSWLGGLIIQWGGGTVGANTILAVSYPLAFINAVFSVTGSIGGSTSGLQPLGFVPTASKTSFNIANSNTQTVPLYWIAIGY